MLDVDKFTVFWSWFNYEEWKFIIAATEDGLCFVGSPNMLYEDLTDWVISRYPDGVLIRDDEKCVPYVNQLAEYFKGERTSFTIPIDLRGTAFQREVWEVLLRIPYGQTVSYTDISNQMGRPSAVRAIGAAIGKNPLLITVPCHRVIAKKGALTGYRGGLDMKEKLLKMEAQLI